MKLLSPVLVFHLALFSSVPIVGGAEEDGDSHDHDHKHEDIPKCAEFNVMDKDTCSNWCGEANMTSKFDIEDRHGDTVDGLHVDIYEGFVCDCITGERRAEEGEAEMHCGYEHELPTCESIGIGDCVDSNVTCSDYCISLGLGDPVTGERGLRHEHYCDHKEGHEEHEEGEEEGEHADHADDGYTICYCNADEAGEGRVSCADEGWEGEHDDHDDEHADDHAETAGDGSAGDGSGASSVAGGLLFSAVVASVVMSPW